MLLDHIGMGESRFLRLNLIFFTNIDVISPNINFIKAEISLYVCIFLIPYINLVKVAPKRLPSDENGGTVMYEWQSNALSVLVA